MAGPGVIGEDTIFALSSGAPPAGIAVIRISGNRAADVLRLMAGRVPEARRASRAVLRDAAGGMLDDGLVIFFPGPRSVTGEDLAEVHCHGGRAVVAAIEAAIAALPGCRRAQPGEFTRRAFAHGRIDLAEAEGLADLLVAETEVQRLAALMLAGGVFSTRVRGWREQLLALSAQIEASLDFSDEDDVAGPAEKFLAQLRALAAELEEALSAPRAEVLREGYRVALAGPPNAGKSTLFNALVGEEAAITADLPGTTRDVLVRPVAMDGVPFSLVDMAGLRAQAADPIEAIGIARAEAELARADLVLWLGPEGQGPPGAWQIAAQIDRRADGAGKGVGAAITRGGAFRVSAVTGEGLVGLRAALVSQARAAMPRPGECALHARQRDLLASACGDLAEAGRHSDPLLIAEHLRHARVSFDRLLGQTGTEEVLDAIFGRFCIGK